MSGGRRRTKKEKERHAEKEKVINQRDVKIEQRGK